MMKVSGKTFPIKLTSELNFLEHFPRDFPSASSQFDYKKFPPPLPHNQNNIWHQNGSQKRHKDKSWLDMMMNPFECESEYEDDYGD
jgi:hypothetical protein